MSLRCGFQYLGNKILDDGIQRYRNTNTGLSESNYEYCLTLKEVGGIWSNEKDTEICIWFLAAIFIIIAVFLGSFIYVSDYKITKADTSVSLDGIYELVLQAVGETDFPFGAASGRQKFLEL